MRKPDLILRHHPETRPLIAEWVADRLDTIRMAGHGSLAVEEDDTLRPSMVIAYAPEEGERPCSWYDLNGWAVPAGYGQWVPCSDGNVYWSDLEGCDDRRNVGPTWFDPAGGG